MWTTKQRSLTNKVLAVAITGAILAAAPQAEARNRFGLGLVAGAIGGALIGGALERPTYAPRYYPAPVYEPVYPTVVETYPVCRTVWHENAWGDLYRVKRCD